MNSQVEMILETDDFAQARQSIISYSSIFAAPRQHKLASHTERANYKKAISGT